jgi:hypothetical protein
LVRVKCEAGRHKVRAKPDATRLRGRPRGRPRRRASAHPGGIPA